MKAPLRVLHLEDDAADARMVQEALQSDGLKCEVTRVKTRDEFVSALGRQEWDIVLSDCNLPGFDGHAALDIVRAKSASHPFIFVSGTMGEEVAVESLKRGATDYILKDRLGRLPTAVRRALRDAQDVEEKKKMEAQFLRAQRLENIGALAGGIAHDLNNGLAPIVMGIDLLRGEMPPDMTERILSTMQGSAQHCANMVRQILTFSKGATGEKTLLALEPLIEDMGRLIKHAFPRSIELQSQAAPGLDLVNGNPTQLHQVLLNLCVNSRDAMPEGGILQIEAANVEIENHRSPWHPEPLSGRYVMLGVYDTGQGMPNEVLKHIFEPFFTTKESGKGTGLGLSTVHSIVKTHRGFIEVESAPAQGTRFKVFLPGIPNAQELPRTPEGPPRPRGNGEQILVIDDEVALLEMTRETLETFNYRILTANNGMDAVSLFALHRDDIKMVITDMMMPVMDGPATIAELRRMVPEVKIMCVSGLGSERAFEKAERLKVNAQLRKPFTTDELLASVRAVIESGCA